MTDNNDKLAPGSIGKVLQYDRSLKNRSPEEIRIIRAEPMRFAVLCSGRGSNFQAIMDASMKNRLAGAQPVAMVADSHYAEAINVAREYGVFATFVPRTAYHANREGFEKRLLEILKPLNVDLVVLAGFQRVLGQVFLSAFPQRIINIHPALLPAFPGHNVWQKEIHHGVKLAGATVHFVDEGVDSGPIIIQGSVPVLESDSPIELAARILKVEHRILPQAVRWIAQGRIEVVGRQVRLKRINEVKGLGELIWPPLDWDNS